MATQYSYIRDVNLAEISGQARKIVFRPCPESMYYKICTVQFFEITYYIKINIISNYIKLRSARSTTVLP